MANMQPAQGHGSSSSHMNSYRGETKLNVTEHRYTWIIRDFAKSSLMQRYSISSPRFIFLHDGAEHPWIMLLYPDSDKTFVRIQLQHGTHQEAAKSKAREMRFTLVINPLNSDKKLVDLDFIKRSTVFGYEHTLVEHNLERYLVNGNLTLVIKIFFDDKDDISIPSMIDDSVFDLKNRLLEFDDFETLFESGKFSDVTLIAGNKKFHVHKNILSARSPVFSAMFQHDMKENHKNEVVIPDIEAPVMKEMLRFIYAGKVGFTNALDPHLFLAANKYGLTRLKDACEMRLIDNINVNNVCDILTIVNLCVPNKLLNAVLEVMRFNSKILKNNEELSKIISKLSPDILAKMFNALMSET